MNNQLVEKALTLIPNKQLLVNIVSRRVRQLSAGSRPMVEITSQMGYADTALSEIIHGYILYQLATDENSLAEPFEMAEIDIEGAALV